MLNSLRKAIFGDYNEPIREPTLDERCHLEPRQFPIVYSSFHDINFVGLQRLHHFDAGKWGKILKFLQDAHFLNDSNFVESYEMSEKELAVVHTHHYLESLKSRHYVAQILEVGPLAAVPHFMIDKMVLKPLRYQTAGTLMAARLALRYGWAINLGGGFHHASSDTGGGFCVYADISIAIKILRRDQLLDKTIIVDLDAHQGNGYERDFMDDPDVHILDMFNNNVYPHDEEAKKAVTQLVELRKYTRDDEYLPLLQTELEKLEQLEKVPNVKYLLIYNAGTDSLEDDPLGRLALTSEGIVKRDQLVFETASKMGIPIVMLTSSGYQADYAEIVARSILNLRRENLIGESKLSENVQDDTISNAQGQL